jgi:arginyl-tRNA synthetase
MLKIIQDDLDAYRISFDYWFSEKTLHDDGQVTQALALLQEKGLVYEHEGALWFKSTEFGDDKDRVVKKSNGELTYIAADIAYHKNKFDRNYDVMIDILGQDHHGYIKRLKATMDALGYDSRKLDVILYQLVTIKAQDVVLRMSKRAGTFTKLRDVIDTVGADVTRFFYLNRKAEAFLEFDLSVAVKKTEENPVFYIQYAYVRMCSLLQRAALDEQLGAFVKQLGENKVNPEMCAQITNIIGQDEIVLLRALMSFYDIARAIANTYQTHLLSYYLLEVAQAFHNYYTNNRIIDAANNQQTQVRLLMVYMVKNMVGTCLDLLGLSKPEKM